MPYIGRGSEGFGIRERYQYTATSNQTAFTGSDLNSKTLAFDNGSLVDVLLNGLVLKPTTDYNTSTANTVTLVSGASTSDEVMIIVYDVFALSDAMPKTGGTFSGALSGVDVNGTELILDADADTSITADTDDQIDFKTGGTDRMNIKSDGNIQFSNGGTSYGNISLTNTDNLTIDCTSSGHAGITFGSAEIFPRKNSANADDDVNIGASSIRFDDIHATNGTIQTSDQNEKQDIASATTKELNVAKKLSSLFKTFRWKSKVTEKGDNARTHTGIIAQEIESAFSAEGLDASKYGLFISHTWWEKDKDVYNTEKEAPSDAIKRTRLGVRYPELFSFIFSSIESRLTALESK